MSIHNIGHSLPDNPFRFVRVSGNIKTGPIPVVSTAAQSCPAACPMRTDAAGGCYASSGNSAIHWRSLTEGKASTAVSANTLLALIRTIPRGQVWRLNEAGDLPHDNQRIDSDFVAGLISANKGRNGFTYTHHDLSAGDNAAVVREMNNKGFTVNISTNNVNHMLETVEHYPGLPMVTLVNTEQWGGKNTLRVSNHIIVRCPAEYLPNMTCAVCKLCANNTRKSIVGFTPHGTGKKRVINIAAV